MCFGGHGGGFGQIFERVADITVLLLLKHKELATGRNLLRYNDFDMHNESGPSTV